MHSADTIVALATPPGAGALALVRLSGPRAAEITAGCIGSRPLEPRRAALVRVQDEGGNTIDSVVATYFAAPASFTGEHTVEFCCHGGMFVVRRLIERLLQLGARPAEPGEFSRRAFENGRLDLAQAEAVMDIINAGSDLALRSAQDQLQGALSRRVAAAADALISVAAHNAAYIDFPEEDIAPDTRDNLLVQLAAIRGQLQALLATADTGRYLREGIRTAIVGAPNVGKSSLLNLLLGYERALVSTTAGTTRDTIEENITLRGLSLRLIDTAGLRRSSDALELAGMERSRQAGAAADLILEVADISCPRASLGLPETGGAKHILILNKSDLPAHPDWENERSAVRLCCRSGEGREQLENAIADSFLHDMGENDSSVAINTRHRYALQEAHSALERAEQSLREGESPEFTDLPLRDALDALGRITGRIDTEDILDRVFSTFCLGK
ncbi:MAG: tRNA uridine-5-carboxymethylaminomethyl(34) synthesis GTPase MnmE [Akkermansia sp.]|nr:tRNA uridine-5-carboxymethylaminomethyl(34) synthesis GTPase MnmE [Akkermansia sp.]